MVATASSATALPNKAFTQQAEIDSGTDRKEISKGMVRPAADVETANEIASYSEYVKDYSYEISASANSNELKEENPDEQEWADYIEEPEELENTDESEENQPTRTDEPSENDESASTDELENTNELNNNDESDAIENSEENGQQDTIFDKAEPSESTSAIEF